MTSLSLLPRVASVPRAALPAHGARDASVPRLPSVSRQTFKAGGARGPQGPLPARRSWEAVLSWRSWQSRLARESRGAWLALLARHPWHALASPEARWASLSGRALQSGASRQSRVSPGPGLGPQHFSRKAPVTWGPNWPR